MSRPVPSSISANAAVAAAAHDVLAALVPSQQALIDARDAAALAAIPNGLAKSNGVLVGRTAAVLILQRRSDDGSVEAFAVPYVPTGVPGDYTFTPPFDETPLGPLAFAPGWGDVTPLANFAMADGYIAGFEAKYDFGFWRPVTAIRAAASDGNRLTHPDASWTPFLITPPVPDYPSTHTVVGAAAAYVLIHFFGDDIEYSTTSVTATGVVRHFEGFSEPAAENGASRAYAGIHFVKAVKDGYRQGKGIGTKTARLLPVVH